MTLTVKIYGEPVLREKSRRVERFDADLRRLAEAMIETMHAEDGVGLAAQQVGETRAVFVLDVPAASDTGEDGIRLNPDVPMPLVVVNPEIVKASRKKDVCEEGCLSFPEIRASIERPAKITLRWQDLEGTTHEQPLQGLVARAAQHEFDHLNGVLLVDRMSPVKRIALRGKLRRLREEHAPAAAAAEA